MTLPVQPPEQADPDLHKPGGSLLIDNIYSSGGKKHEKWNSP